MARAIHSMSVKEESKYYRSSHKKKPISKRKGFSAIIDGINPTKSCQDEYESTDEERNWAYLTPDVLSLILSRLYAEDRFAFKAVCTTWKSITAPPPVPSQIANCPYLQSPVLVSKDRSDCASKLFHPVYNEFYRINLSEIKGAEIRCSKYGWLLMSVVKDHELSLFFFDPFTNVKVELPASIYNFQGLSFSSPPTYSDCSVFGIFTDNSKIIITGTIECGQQNWEYFSAGFSRKCQVSNAVPVLYRGRYYCLDVNGDIIDCGVGILKKILLHKASKSTKRFHRHVHQIFMVEVDNQLLAVSVIDEGRKVCIEKANFASRVWEPVEDLKDKMLYVSQAASFAEVAAMKSMANKIYFPKFHGKSGVFYSLTSGKYHSYDGNYSSTESYGLRELGLATWIQPNVISPDFLL